MRQDRRRLGALRLLLEYAQDELDAIGLVGAAGLVAGALGTLEREMEGGRHAPGTPGAVIDFATSRRDAAPRRGS